MSNTLFSEDTKEKHRYPGLQGDSLFKAQNSLLWSATHYNSNEPSTIEENMQTDFSLSCFFSSFLKPCNYSGQVEHLGCGGVHCIFTFPGTRLAYRINIFYF